ncbi:hypothetical protein [Bifidobacterium sp.]|uniref:hypothetical protein n=1 Tax=Bifidobacterium sp. TaxID=41200 RepID=UPI0025B98377|nr:hypothetical protein [Bifidobacterium sp.]MCI1635224.1 hypothetical protein [Bifidobacterium sp.]
MEATDCRCCKHGPVNYRWAGEDIERQDGETLSRAIARWFASKCANSELGWGNLDFNRFDKYKQRTEAYIEEKINRIEQGKLTPGSEIVVSESARKLGIVMFEFKWERNEFQLKQNKTEHIRHYDAEPEELAGYVFGLHMHLKDVRIEDDVVVNQKQDHEMAVAIKFHRQHENDGWTE